MISHRYTIITTSASVLGGRRTWPLPVLAWARLLSFRLWVLTLVGIQSAKAAEGADAACLDLGPATFCHALRHTETRRNMIPPASGHTGPPTITIGFGLDGWRSCRVAGETTTVDFEVSMSGVSDAVKADYPDLAARVLPSAEELERYHPGGLVSLAVKPNGRKTVDVSTLANVFDFEAGILLPSGNYRINDYVPVEASRRACLAFATGRDE